MGWDESVRRKAKQYTAEYMRDGKEHKKGDALANAAERFKQDKLAYAVASVKRAVDLALNDKSKYVWLGYGRYQLKEAYLRSNDLAAYAAGRITDTLFKAYKDIENCRDTDLTGNDKCNNNMAKVRAAADTILHSLTECERTINDALPHPEKNEKPSVLGRIAEARSQGAAAEKRKRGKPPKSKTPEL